MKKITSKEELIEELSCSELDVVNVPEEKRDMIREEKEKKGCQ